MFGRIKLHPFIKYHPKKSGNVKATKTQIEAFKDLLPNELLELWKKHGFGFYGKSQFQLIDPALWQETLNRWIISPKDKVQRIPIAVTAFGTIIFYRKLTATDEDIATLDPITRSTEILSYNLVEFFNKFMCDKDAMESLTRADLTNIAAKELGILAINEVYQIDEMMLQMEMLKYSKLDAIQVHKDLRDAVDDENAPKIEKPSNIRTAIPIGYLPDFIGTEPSEESLSGLYLSSYIDWFKLILLNEDKIYILLYWRINDRTGKHSEIRRYTGKYTRYKNKDNDLFIDLDFKMNENSLGSDINDSELIVITNDAQSLLLQTASIADTATTIGAYGTMGSTSDYFAKIKLADEIPEYLDRGIKAPLMETLPKELQKLIHTKPLEMTIIEVSDEDPDDDTTIMVKVDLGEDNGLRMNMPVWSAKNSARELHGWVWRMDTNNCGIGIDVDRSDNGEVIDKPQVGDILITTKPE